MCSMRAASSINRKRNLSYLLLIFDPLGNGDDGGSIAILEGLEGLLDELEGGHVAKVDGRNSRRCDGGWFGSIGSVGTG